jgi:hypothetical protein
LNEEEKHLLEKAASLSDVARNDQVDIKDYHQECRKMSLGISASARIGMFGGSAKMNLTQEYSSLSDQEKKEVHSARAVMKNSSEYQSHVKSRHEKEVEGELKRHSSIAKTLNISRVSAAAVAAEHGASGSVVWVSGVETVAKSLALPLAVTKVEGDRDLKVMQDVLAGLVEENRILKENVTKLEKRLKDLKTIEYSFIDITVFNGSIPADQKGIAIEASKDIPNVRNMEWPNLPKGAVLIGVWITPVDQLQGWWRNFNYMNVNVNGGTTTFSHDFRYTTGQP